MTSGYCSLQLPKSCSSSSGLVLPRHGRDFGERSRYRHPSSSFKTLPADESTPSLLQSPPISDPPDDDQDFASLDNGATLKYISDMLMEEDLEGKTCAPQDCLALQATEKPFYDVIGQKYPYKAEGMFNCKIDDDSASVFNMDLCQSSSCLRQSCHYRIDSPESTLSGPELIRHTCSPVTKGHASESSAANSSDSSTLPLIGNSASVSSDEDDRDLSPDSSRERKIHLRDEEDHVEERNSKQSAPSVADYDGLSEMFDAVLLCKPERDTSVPSPVPDYDKGGTSQSVQRKGVSGKNARGKKRGNERELVDLWTLLTQCAQAVASSDQRTANELLNQLNLHSSVDGDVNQRVAYYFSIALRARLVGLKTPGYDIHLTNTMVFDIIKAYQMYVQACPFHRMSFFFANGTILKLAGKAKSLHIIDFGVYYGFQWPCLIQKLSERPGGPPKLRITGIELPQAGFRPAQCVEETMQRLTKYCERFNVPFESTTIAKKWETIRYEELRLDKDDITVVNCMFRMKNIADDTVAANCPRDTVLNLIHRIKPDLFIHGIVNGTYNAPFFLTRFREALFYFFTVFDLFEATVPRNNEQRLAFERLVYGRDILNTIACEGVERVERPETYKQWQSRNQRAGFRQVPLDRDILSKVESKIRLEYNKDYVVDEDGQWLLQGWKGRITRAIALWRPV